MTGKLPEGRKPLPDEWFIDRASKLGPGKAITPMTQEERDRAKVRSRINQRGEQRDGVRQIHIPTDDE